MDKPPQKLSHGNVIKSLNSDIISTRKTQAFGELCDSSSDLWYTIYIDLKITFSPWAFYSTLCFLATVTFAPPPPLSELSPKKNM